MGWCLIDLAFRLERRVGVRIRQEQIDWLAGKHAPPDIRVGELFDLIRGQPPQLGVFDQDQDADVLWRLFQREVSDGLDTDEEEVTKDKWFVKELGGG